MKLTNYIRDAFVAAAMEDVPSVDYDEQIRAALLNKAIALLPPKVRAIYADKKLREYLEFRYVGVQGVSVYAPMSRDDDDDVVREVIKTAAATLLLTRDDQDEARRDLKGKLRSIAYGCSTRKALAEALPEFERYLPADVENACRSLPVIANVVSDFVQAGWPKDKKASKAKKGAA